jgi:hypothetical protein
MLLCCAPLWALADLAPPAETPAAASAEEHELLELLDLLEELELLETWDPEEGLPIPVGDAEEPQ